MHELSTKQIGNQAEKLVAQELIRQGYTVMQLNWRTRYCEVDIICRKDTTIYFVEVKYRHSSRQGDGFEYITVQKLRHMQRAAELWLAKYQWSGECALMAVAVDATGVIELVEL